MINKEIEIKRDAGPHYRYKMPLLQSRNLRNGNGIKTTIVNAKFIADAIGRTIENLTQWYSYSLGVQTKQVLSGEQIYLNGDHQQRILIEKLYEFIDAFVICPACSNPETHYILENNNLHLHCKSCGNTTQIKSSKSSCLTKMENWIKIHIEKVKIKQTSENLTFQNDDEVKIDIENLEELVNKFDDKTKKQPNNENQDDFFEQIKKMVNDENIKDENIFSEIQNYKNKWSVNDRWLTQVLFHALFEDNPYDMINIIMKRRNLLILFLLNENEQKIFLSILTKFISKTNPQLLTSAPIIFYILYDNEIIEYNGFLKWLNKPSKSLEGSQKVGEYIRKVILKDFSKWVKEAPYENGDDLDEAISENEESKKENFNDIVFGAI